MCAPLHTCEQLSPYTTHTHTQNHANVHDNRTFFGISNLKFLSLEVGDAEFEVSLGYSKQTNNNHKITLRKQTRKKGEEGVNGKRQDGIKKRKKEETE